VIALYVLADPSHLVWRRDGLLPDGAMAFNDVFVPFFRARQGEAGAADFRFEPTSHSFLVTGVSPSPPGAPLLGLTLFAALAGPRREHFSCFMVPLPNGSHACPHAERLEPGEWAGSVVFVRHYAAGRAAECGGGLRGEAAAPLSLRRYILAKNFSTFDDYRECFGYPHTSALNFTWHKTALAVGGGEGQAGSVCAGGEGPGRWVALPSRCAPPLCAGAPDPRMLGGRRNAGRGLRHVFVPWGCHYRFFRAREARACLAARRVLLVGDSRVRNLADHVEAWLGARAAPQFVSLVDPHRFGLAWGLRSGAADAVADALAEGRTVVMSSLLHDIGNFRNDTAVADIRRFWAAGSCPGCDAGEVLACQWCLQKRGAPRAYQAHLHALVKVVRQGRARAQARGVAPGRAFWLSQHKRQPVAAEEAHTWQFSDILHSLEDLAAGALGAGGVRHVDLRPHLLAAPAGWWDDKVHWGKDDRSMFKHMSLQVVLNRVCGADDD
jgi:hypothetical protein